MSHADPQRLPEGDDRPELAELLSDQFALLDDVRPVGARAVIDGDGLVFAFGWPLFPADELLLGTGYGEQVKVFRSELLNLITPSLVELVEIEVGREVRSSEPSLAAGLRDAMVRFALGPRTSTEPEAIEALRNWSEQVRRQATRRCARYRERSEELRRLREQIARRRRAHGARGLRPLGAEPIAEDEDAPREIRF